MNFAPLHLHTVYSLLDGVGKPDKIAARCQELGYSACAATDHGNVSSAVKFMKACKAKGIKPIIGCEFYVAEQGADVKSKDNNVAHQVILAKNMAGWKKLVKLVSASNDEQNFYYRPRIDKRMLEAVNPNGDLISFSGHIGSTLDLAQDRVREVDYMKDLFGAENFFVEIQRIYGDSFPRAIALSDDMRSLASLTGTKAVATGDSHYVDRNDAILQQIMLCSSLKITMKDAEAKIKSGENFGLSGFFTSNAFHIPSLQDVIDVGNTEEEIYNTQLIADMCEEYSITGPPKVPRFKWTDGMSEAEFLRKLCSEGMKTRGLVGKPEYVDRLNRELMVVEEATLSGYFLIVNDYVQWAKNQGYLVGPGRGSAAGCLISYLIRITGLDPLKHNLLFERFYNAGRKGSLPDIDMDFPASKRDLVVDYIRTKYGKEYVSQISTYSRMQGKGAVKEVFRNYNVCNADAMNKITENIPNEAEISDLLEEQQEDSIIRWTLRNEPEVLQDWCRIQDDDSLTGIYAKFFGYAIELEGVLRNVGKHAAGVIVSAEPIEDICPTITDKESGEKIAAMDMKDLEAMSFVKLDILGLSALDKLQTVNNLLMKGTV